MMEFSIIFFSSFFSKKKKSIKHKKKLDKIGWSPGSKNTTIQKKSLFVVVEKEEQPNVNCILHGAGW